MSYDGPDTITDGVRLKVIKTGLFMRDVRWSLCCSDSLDLHTLTRALFSRLKSQTRR